jgi:hypothetical protein
MWTFGHTCFTNRVRAIAPLLVGLIAASTSVLNAAAAVYVTVDADTSSHPTFVEIGWTHSTWDSEVEAAR